MYTFYSLGFPISYPLQKITNYINTAVQNTFTNTLELLPVVDDNSKSVYNQISHTHTNHKFTLCTPQTSDRNSMQQRKNLLILDWDDTIFPTSVVKKHIQLKDGNLYTPAFAKQMDELVICLKDIFEEMIKIYGSENIIIVTNATYSWIYDQCPVFSAFKLFLEFLKINDISIISAQSDYGHLDSECRSKWKEFAFTDICSKYFNNQNDIINCITSIGDSYDEFDASETVSNSIKNRILHRIKFKFKPSIKDIIIQMRNLKSVVYKFVISTEDMEVRY
eukprot:760496_1